MSNVTISTTTLTNTSTNEETIVFTDEAMFMAHLEYIESVSEWRDCTTDLVELSVNPNFNPFPQLGGEKFGVEISLDGGFSSIPMRETAIGTLFARCDVSGAGLRRLLESDTEKFASHINDYLALKPENRHKMLALIQEGKLSALHSGNYAAISMLEIFEAVKEYFADRMEAEFVKSWWSYEATYAEYEITDLDVIDAYAEVLNKHVRNPRDIKMHLIVESSDVQLSAVRCIPMISFSYRTVPLVGKTATRHTGKASIDDVESSLENAFEIFESSCRSVQALSTVTINNPKNAMIKAFTYLRIPQKYASEIAEKFDNNSQSTALDVYLAMCEVIEKYEESGANGIELLNIEETIAKLLTFTEGQWKAFDVYGTVAWNAKEK